MNPRINKLLDFGERVGWTFVQAYVSLGLLDWLSAGMNLNFLHQLYAALGAAAAATIKVLIAQNMGKSDDGALPSPIAPSPKDDSGPKRTTYRKPTTPRKGTR